MLFGFTEACTWPETRGGGRAAARHRAGARLGICTDDFSQPAHPDAGGHRCGRQHGAGGRPSTTTARRSRSPKHCPAALSRPISAGSKPQCSSTATSRATMTVPRPAGSGHRGLPRPGHAAVRGAGRHPHCRGSVSGRLHRSPRRCRCVAHPQSMPLRRAPSDGVPAFGLDVLVRMHFAVRVLRSP